MGVKDIDITHSLSHENKDKLNISNSNLTEKNINNYGCNQQLTNQKNNNKFNDKTTRSEKDLKLQINYKDLQYFISPSSNESRYVQVNGHQKENLFNVKQNSGKIINHDPIINNITDNKNSLKSSLIKNNLFKNTYYSEKESKINFNEKLQNSVKKINILIVDDEQIIRKSEANVIKKFFKKNKVDVQIYEGEDGVEGLYKIYMACMNGIKFDLIITDETMNFMKGTTMSKIIKGLVKDNILYDVKICMITSYESTVAENRDALEILDMIGTKPLSNNLKRLYIQKFFK